MRIVAQTIFTPPLVIYDTAGKPMEEGTRKLIKGIVRPTVQVLTDEGRPLYKTGDFYTPYGYYFTIGALLFGALGIVAKLAKR